MKKEPKTKDARRRGIIRIAKHFSGFLFVMVSMTLLITSLVHASPDLNITVNASGQTFCPMHTVEIYGNLTRNGNPVSDGLVALEVKNPSDDTIVVRTLQTGTTLPAHNIIITKLMPCDPLFQPKNSFGLGETAYFLVFVNKTSPGEQPVLVTLSVYDATNVPIGDLQRMQFTFLGQGGVAWVPNFWIPTWASTGTAKVIVGTYTDWPSNGGTPLGPENSSSFTIYEPGGGSLEGAQASGTSGDPDGTYSFSFATSIEAETGLYTVYVAASYLGEQATANTTFLVDVPDVNGDGYVNIWDLGLLSDAWLSELGDPDYNPNADFNGDGTINVWDLAILSNCWLYSSS